MRYIKFISLMMMLGAVSEGNSQDLQKELSMNNRATRYGIVGQSAPELKVSQWIDGQGAATEDIRLSELDGKFKVIYCFQAWCPGCHSRGLPSLKKMSAELKDNPNVEFMAIQTVFEGESSNTYDRMVEIQKQYDLDIPFGHDPGDATSRHRSTTMNSYRTGGTPWFIFIDQKGQVVFNDYHLDTDKAIDYLKTIEKI